MKLTPKQEAFCNYYIESGNASEAYRRAFCCAKMKDKTINECACKLLANPKIAARVKEFQDELKKKSDLSKERILEELKCILDAKITDYITLQNGKLTFKDFDKLTESQVKAIESVKEGKNGIEMKLHGKSWTIEQICKMLGYDAPIKQEVKIEEKPMSKEEAKQYLKTINGDR
jgi:phage terminase small subunit